MIGCDCAVCRSTDPRDQRLRSSAMVEVFDSNNTVQRIIIDTGPDFRQQMLRHNVRHIDAVLFTHFHKDHMGGMDDLRSYYYMSKKAVPVYCQRDTAKAIRREFNYAFNFKIKRFAAVPRFDIHTIRAGKTFLIAEGVEITPIRVMHKKLQILGFRIGELCYITDANYISQESIEQIKGCKTLVINALRHTPHESHFTLAEALEIVGKIKPQRTILTHISHQLGLFEDISSKLPDGVEIGFDNLETFC